METQPDKPEVWRPKLALTTTENIRHIHQAATAILDQTGLNVHHPAMRDKLAAAGARMGDGQRVFITPMMVDRALAGARRDIIIHNRSGQPVMPLGPHQIYFGTGSDLIHTRDATSGVRRPSILEDVARAARLCDALAEIDFVMSFGLPQDIPDQDIEPTQYSAMVNNTTKPIIMTSFSGLDSLERLHEMACLVAGGNQAFRDKPNYILYGQFLSPLQHNTQAIERLVFCADHEVPLIYVPTIMPMASGPATLAGSLALATAEWMAGLVMHQIQNPGAPFIAGACVGPLDARTMLFPYGGPDWRLNDLFMAEQGRHYQLPVFGTAGTTDSKVVDAQTGAEYAHSLMIAALAGTNLIHDVGYLESGLTGSLESIVLGAEQIRYVKQFLEGILVSEEALALDVIHEIEPGNDFLSHPHTLQHFREGMWSPYVSNHQVHDSWVANGSRHYEDEARELAIQILQSHKIQPLPSETQTELDGLCQMN